MGIQWSKVQGSTFGQKPREIVHLLTRVSSGCVLIEAKVRSQVRNATRSVFVILEFEQDFIEGYSQNLH